MTVGFDLGGTKMLAALVDEDGTVRAREKRKTTDRGGKDLVEAIGDTIEELLDDNDVDSDEVGAIGIAVPGPVGTDGVILETANLGLDGVELAPALSRRFKIPVRVENDVNAGLWGEFTAGAARGFTHVVGVFPGTGIGGAVIVDGKLVRGARGGAGEVGHITVQSDGRLCGCGNFGCLETVASKTAIARDLAVLALNGSSQVLVDAGATDIAVMRSGLIAKALAEGDLTVAAVIDRAAEFLGIGVATLVNILNPQAVILGGGLIEKLGARYTDTVRSTMHARAMRNLAHGVVVKEAELGDDAVVLGVADLARSGESVVG